MILCFQIGIIFKFFSKFSFFSFFRFLLHSPLIILLFFLISVQFFSELKIFFSIFSIFQNDQKFFLPLFFPLISISKKISFIEKNNFSFFFFFFLFNFFFFCRSSNFLIFCSSISFFFYFSSFFFSLFSYRSPKEVTSNKQLPN